jgi:hypothetical protein
MLDQKIINHMAEKPSAGQTAVPSNLTGMDDGELAERLLDRIRTGNVVAAEELEIKRR